MVTFDQQLERAIQDVMQAEFREHLLRCGVPPADLGEWALRYELQTAGTGPYRSVVTIRWEMMLLEVHSLSHLSLARDTTGDELRRYVCAAMDFCVRQMVASILQRKAVLVGCRRWLIDAAKAELARLAAETRATLAGADWPRLYGGGVWVWNPNSQMDEMILTWMNDFRQFVLQVSQPLISMQPRDDARTMGSVAYHTLEWRRYVHLGARWQIGKVEDASKEAPWGREWWLHLVRHVYSLITMPLSADESAEIMKLAALDRLHPCRMIQIQPFVYVTNTGGIHVQKNTAEGRGLYGREEAVKARGFSPAARSAGVVGGLPAGTDDCAGSGRGGGGGAG